MSILFSDAKQYLRDTVFFDTDDAKSQRQATIVINRALERVNSDHNWSFYNVYKRVNIVPRQSGYFAATVGSNTFGTSRAWDDSPTGQHIQLQEATTTYTVASGDGGSTLYSIADQTFSGSGTVTSGLGFVHYDTYDLPSGVRNVSVVYDSNLFGAMDYLDEDDFMHHLRRVGPYATGPYAYTITRNEVNNKPALRFWPTPSASGTMDFFCYRFATKPDTDTDTLDWDPEKDGLFYAALDYEGARLVFRGKGDVVESLREARHEYERLLKDYKGRDIIHMDLGGLSRPQISSDNFKAWPVDGT